jgi:hypothetical protein
MSLDNGFRDVRCADLVTTAIFSFSEGSIHGQPIMVILFSVITEFFSCVLSGERIGVAIIAVAAVSSCFGWIILSGRWLDDAPTKAELNDDQTSWTFIEWGLFFATHVYARRWSFVASAAGAPAGMMMALAIQCISAIALYGLRSIRGNHPCRMNASYVSTIGISIAIALMSIPWMIGWRRFHIDSGIMAAIVVSAISLGSSIFVTDHHYFEGPLPHVH